MKMEAVCSSETLVQSQNGTRYSDLQVHHLYSNPSQDFKSHTLIFSPEDGGNAFLRNVDTHPKWYKVQQTTRKPKLRIFWDVLPYSTSQKILSFILAAVRT
jgi:hypothetical protein